MNRTLHLSNFRNTWDCNTCISDVSAVSDLMASDISLQNIVVALQGDGFCEDPSMELNENQVETCKMFIKDFLPPCVKAVMEMLKTRSDEACNEFFDGICKFY